MATRCKVSTSKLFKKLGRKHQGPNSKQQGNLQTEQKEDAKNGESVKMRMLRRERSMTSTEARGPRHQSRATGRNERRTPLRIAM